MPAEKNIMVIPTILFLLIFIYLALSLKNNSTKIMGAVVIEPGFSNLQPQIGGRHYQSNGQYTVNLRSYSNTPLTITEIKLTEKISQKQCNTTYNTGADAINYKGIVAVSAKCPRRAADDVYVLSAEINYEVSGEKGLHQETGDITGDVEP